VCYIKHERPCLTTFPNNSKFVKNTPLRVVFSTLFSVFGNVVKHGLSCLIYHIQHKRYDLMELQETEQVSISIFSSWHAKGHIAANLVTVVLYYE